MTNIKAEEAMHDLTLMLLYLSRFAERVQKFSDAKDFYAWKGYNFDVLNKLVDADFIRQGDRPSRSKVVYLTEDGIAQAKTLLSKYGITDWQKNRKI